MFFYYIFKYYRNVLKETNIIIVEQIYKIAKYYIINTLSYQQLMIKYNIINEYREVVSIAFILLFDIHYFAVGIKVCNLLSTNAWQEGILTSIISCEQIETGKYPRVYVFSSVKDLENRCSIISLDFTSLYSSLIMTYNLLSDKIILSQKYAKYLKKSNKKLYEINFKFNNQDVLT